MVNSGTFDTNAIGQGDRNAKFNRQPSDAVDVSCDSVTSTADGDVAASTYSNDESTTSDETSNKNLVAEDADGTISDEDKGTLCCSVPLDKVQGVLTPFSPPKVEDHKPTRKLLDLKRKEVVRMTLLCLYCERSFASANLRQKHVERIHSVKKNRRLSSRKQNQMTVTPCFHCDKFSTTENTQKDLFEHLVNEHSDKYFGCLPCEERFLTNSLLTDHNTSQHPIAPEVPEKTHPVEENSLEKEVTVKLTRSKTKPKTEESLDDPERVKKTIRSKNAKLKELRSKKLTVKSSRIALNRRESKRLQAISDAQKKKRQKPVERGKQTTVNKTDPAPEKSSCINPYPEFDHFYRVKKITDHSIDNLKISSLTFDDVFDKTFFNRIKCNIEENLLHHIDGKLFKNEESENRISNFEKVSSVQQEIQNSAVENFGCELTLNAVTPVASLSLNSQYGEDFESQIEYGAKPSKKKTQTKKDEVHYKYFTRRKFQASILEQTENRDLSKLDMWTQLVIKKRQQKIIDDKKTPKEIQEYTTCDEYKNKIRREELNRILDRRGPFEDLREEASKKAALDKLNSDSEDSISHESFTEVREVLNEILNRVFEMTEKMDVHVKEQMTSSDPKQPDLREIPGFLNLRRKSSLTNDGEMDQSDKITLICSSQETENFELPTNSTRRKDELIELSGEWARCRMYICAACGAKLPNMRYLLDHKTIYHQNVWVQHYEFVGNQSELYRHLSIPALGKVGFVENSVQCKSWKRSDARTCTKCKKQCNTLGELHRHILECGGDWTWMLARKKCKYRYGAKSRRKRRGLVVRVHHHKRKTDSAEKKKYKYDGPRQRPSDAETIQRMLANLPAKRSTRKLISLYDGVRRRQKNQELENAKQKKVKCGKVIYSKSSNIKETTEKTINTQKSSQSSNMRSLRSLNRVLSSKILDTTTTLSVKRKLKVLNDRRKTRQSVTAENTKELDEKKDSEPRKKLEKTEVDESIKKTSPKNANIVRKLAVKKLLTGNINIKSFFPVKKMKNKKENVTKANLDIQTRSKTKTEDEKVEERIPTDSKAKKNNINKKKTKKASQEVAQNKDTRKRNLKQSFRSVINRVKRLKIDNAPEKVQTDNKPPIKSPFLDELKQEKDPVKIVIPSTLEAKENSADISETAHTVIPFNEDSTVPENIFKLDSNNEKNLQAKGEPNFDFDTQPSTDLKPITIETSEKPKTLPMISPNVKGKIRKPARGLNDCIAMLTSKLQQKSNENLPQPKPITSTDCILKIPTFKIQNEACEEVALDLSIKTRDKSSEPAGDLNKLTSVEKIIENVVNNKKLPAQYLFNSIDLTIQNVINGHLKSSPTRTTVDDIIDYVINVDKVNNTLLVKGKDDYVVDKLSIHKEKVMQLDKKIEQIKRNRSKRKLENEKLVTKEIVNKFQVPIESKDITEDEPNKNEEVESVLNNNKQNLRNFRKQNKNIKITNVNEVGKYSDGDETLNIDADTVGEKCIPAEDAIEDKIPKESSHIVEDKVKESGIEDGDIEAQIEITIIGKVKDTEDINSEEFKVSANGVNKKQMKHLKKNNEVTETSGDLKSEVMQVLPKKRGRKPKIIKKNTQVMDEEKVPVDFVTKDIENPSLVCDNSIETKVSITQTKVEGAINGKVNKRVKQKKGNNMSINDICKGLSAEIMSKVGEELKINENLVPLEKSVRLTRSKSPKKSLLNKLQECDKVGGDGVVQKENFELSKEILVNETPKTSKEIDLTPLEVDSIGNKEIKSASKSGRKKEDEEIVNSMVNDEIVNSCEGKFSNSKEIESVSSVVETFDDYFPNNGKLENNNPVTEIVDKPKGKKRGRKPKKMENTTKEIQNEDLKIKLTKKKRGRKPKAVNLNQEDLNVSATYLDPTNTSKEDLNTTEIFSKTTVDVAEDFPTPEQSEDDSLKEPIKTIEDKGKYLKNLSVSLENLTHEQMNSDRIKSLDFQLENHSTVKRTKLGKSISLDTSVTETVKLSTKRSKSSLSDLVTNVDCVKDGNKTRSKSPKKLLINLTAEDVSFKKPSDDLDISFTERDLEIKENKSIKSPKKLTSKENELPDNTKQTRSKSSMKSTVETVDTNIKDQKNEDGLSTDDSALNITNESDSELQSIDSWESQERTTRSRSPRKSKISPFTPKNVTVLTAISSKNDTDSHVDSLDIKIVKKSKGRNRLSVSNSLERSNPDSGFEDQKVTPKRKSSTPDTESKKSNDSLDSSKIKESLTVRRTRSSTNILMSSSESLSKLNDSLDAEVCNILSQSEFNVPDSKSNSSKSRSSSLRNIFDSPSITESSEAESVSPDQKIKRNNKKCKKYFTSEESLDKLDIANTAFNPPEIDFVKPITGKKSKNQTPSITEEYSCSMSESSDVESDKSKNLNLEQPSVTNIEKKDLIDPKTNPEESLYKPDTNTCTTQLEDTSLIQSELSFQCSEADKSSETSHDVILEEKIRNAIRQSLLSIDSSTSTTNLDEPNLKLSSVIDIDIGTSSRSLRKKSVVNYSEQEETKEISGEPEGVRLENNNNVCKDSTTEFTDNILDEVKLDDRVVEETNLKVKDESENYILKENLCKNTLLTTNNGVNKNRMKLKPKRGRKKILKNKNSTVTTNLEDKNSPVDVDTTFLTTIPLTDTTEKEPPIKIIINKQKARRKSKSIKKVGEKGNNDLFEDFSLVIKKKRIITFSPLNTFSKEDPFPMEKLLVSEELQEKEDLNDSVQEMDMELDEIPIETSIIETPKLDLPLPNKYETKEGFLKEDTISKNKKSKNNYSLEQQSEFKLPLLKISTKLNKTEQIFEKNCFLSGIINDTNEEFAEVEVFKQTNNENEDSVKVENFVTPVVIRRSRKSKKKGLKRKIKNHSEEISTDVDFQIKSETSDKLFAINNLESLENLFNDVNSVEKILEGEEKEVEKPLVEEIDKEMITRELKVSKRGKKKGGKKKLRSKTLSTDKCIDEINEDIEELENEVRKSLPCYMKVNDVTTKEEIEKIYAFSETEDFEIEKPIELPRRLPRKSENDEKVKELEPIKRKQKSKTKETLCNNLEKEENLKLVSEVSIEECEKEDRKIMRTAKVKALEHIHDEALAELTDVDVDKKSVKETKNAENANKKVKNKKKIEKSFDFHSEAPLLEDLVAELNGFEELDNSIERELRAEEELETIQQKDDQILLEENSLTVEENQEPRRSRRGSRKVASYNENDLIDPLIDAIENKRKGRKKDEKSAGDVKQRKLNSDELFDLLKASTNDNIFVPKQNLFSTNLEDSSREGNFDSMFENISEKSENNDNFIEEKSINQDSNAESKTNSLESNYCEICNKSFVKLENLIKHRRTLTHIQKLSELEAREVEKSKIISRHEDDNSRESVIEPPSLIQADKILESSFKTHSLKLADIINDVLTKPTIENETKRYKSLGERKSFDSDTLISTDTQPFVSKTQIVEKQISLLENIIENQTVSNYIDDISLSSEKSDTPSEPSVSKPSDNNSFLKPTQYEEISEDSANLRNYDDPKLRKTLNRDEELFLECCSLLKSSSEVSSGYSNKKIEEKKVIGALKPIDESAWMEKKNFIPHQRFEDIDDYSDNSRIPTPLGNSYDDDASNSNTISSNWGMDQSIEDNRVEVCDVRLTFENISKNQEIEQDEFIFDGILSRSLQVLPNKSSPKTSTDEQSDGSLIDNKKIMTKGARKVFEGLKVSIPTEELNLEEVLNYSPKQKKTDLVIDNEVEVVLTSPTQKCRNSRKSKPVKKAQVGSNLLFKVNKKKLPSPTITNKELQKDVYDFEETQDNTEAFTKPDFKAFRNLKSNESEPDLLELDAVTVASSKKSKAQENSTKKKCMIMGRIFKNAAKSKVEDIDEEIRKIPAIDNEELVENYVNNQTNLVCEDVPELEVDKDKKQPKKQEQKKKIKLKGKKRTRTNSESTDDEFSLNKTIKRRTNKKNHKEEDNVINLEQELKECIGVASRKSQRKCTSGKQNVLVEYWSSDDSQFEALLEKQIIEVKPREKQAIEIPLEPPKEEIVQEDNIKKPLEVKKVKKKSTSGKKKPKCRETTADGATVNRRKRAAVNPLYHWSSSSEDEASDLIEIKPLRDEIEDDEDRPVQHGWIVGDSPKKLVTMLAQAKGKKSDVDCVKEQGKKRTNTVS